MISPVEIETYCSPIEGINSIKLSWKDDNGDVRYEVEFDVRLCDIDRIKSALDDVKAEIEVALSELDEYFKRDSNELNKDKQKAFNRG